jgi:hypothetical protein
MYLGKSTVTSERHLKCVCIATNFCNIGKNSAKEASTICHSLRSDVCVTGWVGQGSGISFIALIKKCLHDTENRQERNIVDGLNSEFLNHTLEIHYVHTYMQIWGQSYDF